MSPKYIRSQLQFWVKNLYADLLLLYRKRTWAVLIPAALLVLILIPVASAGQTYIVGRGDTLGAIARQFNTTVDLLVSANDIQDKNRIEVGQELTIPTIYSAYNAPQPYRSRAVTNISSAYSLRPHRSAYASAYNITYQVAYGDSLAKIAGKYDITIDSIRDSNNLYSDVIYVGQELVIPAVLSNGTR